MRVRSEADFDSMLRGAKLLAVASAWSELGYWDRLAHSDEPLRLSALEGESRALRISAGILMHAGLLNGGADRIELSSLGREMYERGQLPTARNLESLDDLSRITEVIKSGGPVRGADGVAKVTRGGVRPDDVERTRRFLDMLYRRSEASARVAADWISQRLAPGASILDVGGGHGRYSEEFASRGFDAWLFDLPHVIGIAGDRHGEAISYVEGDFHEDEFGGPYDAVFLSNVVHGESSAANARMLTRLGAALNPGGWIIIKDMFLDEMGNEPENAVFFAQTMLYYTAEGNSYSYRDAVDWCEQAGLRRPEVVVCEGYALVFARRDGS